MSSPFTLSVTDDALNIALRAWLLGVVGADVEVIQGQDNRVPEPEGDDFIVFTPRARRRVSTNVDAWDMSAPADTLNMERGTFVEVQLDVHGPQGADLAQIIATMWRDEYGVSTFDPNVAAPLYATDGQQMPFINGEKQYEYRWVMTLHLHVKPVVSTPADFADSLAVTIMPPVGD